MMHFEVGAVGGGGGASLPFSRLEACLRSEGVWLFVDRARCCNLEAAGHGTEDGSAAGGDCNETARRENKKTHFGL